MNISGKCDYACRAMLELAARYNSGTPVSSQIIAEQRSIPEKYLTHILLQLKRTNLVYSVRGAQGGYILAKLPANITLLHIIEAIEGPIITPTKKESEILQELKSIWKSAAEKIDVALSSYTLDKMLEMTSKSNMFHI
jgi:Rrf2 family transcriptional regulator, cysteine metabolism repressor